MLLLAAVVLALCLFSFRVLGVWVAAGARAPVSADLVVVLGGEDGHRVKKGVEVFRSGFAPSVLLTGIEASPAQERAYYLNWLAQVLADAGVPAGRVLFETNASNSFEEARATLAMLQAKAWNTALVVSDPPHMRRLDWVWGKVFEGSGKSYVLVASEPAWWDAAHWWQSEKSGQFVLTELVKMGYYRVKY